MQTQPKHRRFSIYPYLLLVPALLIMLSVVIVPIVNAVSMSFQNYNLTRPNKIGFIGVQNYVKLFNDKIFWGSLGRTLIWVLFGVGGQFVFGFMLAVILNKSFRGRGIVRAVSLIPWVTPGVLIALMWTWMYDGNYGVINDLLMKLGLISDKIAFLARKDTAMPSVIITIIWQGIPFFALMILAGLQGIPGDLYEAADIDGATQKRQFFSLTIPLLGPVMQMVLMNAILGSLKVTDLVLTLTNGKPSGKTEVMMTYIYKRFFGEAGASAMDYGYGAALTVVTLRSEIS